MSKIMQDLRQEIDKIDDAILELLNKRLILASQIGKIKNQTQKGILDLQREQEIIERLARKQSLRQDQIEKIYHQIFLLTKQIQEEEECSFIQ